MANYEKILLSGSTNGRPIKITATTVGAANTIHTAHAASLDELVLTAWNTDSVERTLTLRYGDDADILPYLLPANSGPVQIAPQLSHLLATGSIVIKAYADAANVVWLAGCVNRITA